MPSQSAEILLFRKTQPQIEFFLVHPGGPFWKNKDLGAWSIPKGEFKDSENAVDAAIRELKEETGFVVTGQLIQLTPVRQKAGKIIHAWGAQGDLDANQIVCNTFKMQWPPGSGTYSEFPEVDKAAWFNLKQAHGKINPAQSPNQTHRSRCLMMFLF